MPFGIVLRQRTGLVESLLRPTCLGPDRAQLQHIVAAPEGPEGQDPLSRRARFIASADRKHRHQCRGLRVGGSEDGAADRFSDESNARKHGGTKRRIRRKIHIRIDAQTLETRAAELTISNIGDAPVVGRTAPGVFSDPLYWSNCSTRYHRITRSPASPMV